MESVISPQDLETFGLTSYEAKVYYSMIPLGSLTAKEVSDTSSIPFGRIYDTLTRLVEKGVIESQDTRPKKYKAIEPRIALKNLLDAKDQDLLRIKEVAPTIEEKLAQMYNNNSNESLFWNVALESETIEKHNQKILEAQHELLIYLNTPSVMTSHVQKELKFFIDALKEILSRGVIIKVLFGGIDEKMFKENISIVPKEFLALLATLDYGITPKITNTFDIIDNEKVVIKILNPVNEEEFLALIYLWQSTFAIKMREKFFQLWEGAKKPKIEFG